jgi:hypothetical protein
MRTDYAERARARVGTRFRPQGRDERGLDCVGLVIATYGIPIGSVRRDYRLKGDHRAEAEQVLAQFFRRLRKREARPGDALLMEVVSDQLHLAVLTACGVVHAHAGLMRVVETPGEPEWPVIGIYRKRTRERSS